MKAKTLMIQGTASAVGKSLLTTALCRRYRRAGRRVAPFKAQNISLNAAVTPCGCEIGRAQAEQAAAAGVVPTPQMNPLLLKPEGEGQLQMVVMGHAVDRAVAAAYLEQRDRLRQVVSAAIAQLRAEYELVIIEGAGSPAEINLREGDIVNMDLALRQRSPVLIVGDIDRGGVFASFVGTLVLLSEAERQLVRGFLVNKFRGDQTLLRPGLDQLEALTARPVLGVMPHIGESGLPDEDGVALERSEYRVADAGQVEIAVIRLPRISNFDEFAPLVAMPAVRLNYVDRPAALASADLVILPGSKGTLNDLRWLRERGLAQALAERAARQLPILGICGGCQMLGMRIDDSLGVEGGRPASVAGLNLLPIETQFVADKRTVQLRARIVRPSFLGSSQLGELEGYLIHHGRIRLSGCETPVPLLFETCGAQLPEGDGASSADGAVVGTMIHGLFENAALRRYVVHNLAERRGLAVSAEVDGWDRQAIYERLADIAERAIDFERLDAIIAAG